MLATTTRVRAGWAKYGILLVLFAGGVGGGLYLAKYDVSDDAPLPKPNDSEVDTVIARFPLTEMDVGESMESAEIACDEKGILYLAWATRTDEDERQLLFTRSSNGGRSFEKPRVFATSRIYRAQSRMKGKTITRELKMVPHLAIEPGKIHLAWTEALVDGTGVQTVLATSLDRGDTFSEPRSVHRGKARTTFTDIAVGPTGQLACSWLDNRNKSQQPFAAVRQLNHSNFAEEQLVYPGQEGRGICPCCPTNVLVTTDGTIYLAFRNLDNGYRDIAICVRRPGRTDFEGPYPVTTPTWQFQGCPHDGPSMALVGEMLHVSWMDASLGSPRCFHAKAHRDDMKFQVRELHPIERGSQGNAKLFADADGDLHAVWEESSMPAATHSDHKGTPSKLAGGRAILYRSLPKGESTFGPVHYLAPSLGAYQTRPSLTVSPTGEVHVAWSELDESGKSIVVATVRKPCCVCEGDSNE